MKNTKIKHFATLDEAILHTITVGSLSDFSERMYHVLKEFIVREFGRAYLEMNDPKTFDAFQKLFEKLIRRSK